MAEMKVSPLDEIANPYVMKVFAVEIYEFFFNLVFFRLLCGVQSSPLVFALMWSTTGACTARDSVLQVCALVS